MRPSRVLARLHQGHPVLFYALHFTDASVWELASLIGIDCLWLDLEHHGHTLETAAQLIRAARVGTSDVIARPAKGEWMRMQRMLEIGAQGLLYPRCHSADEARELVRWCKFAPLGERGCDGAGADAPYCSIDLAQYVRLANEQTFLIVQIEDEKTSHRAEEILAVAGVDGVMLGPGDFSVLEGFPGQTDHPRVQQALDRLAQAAANTGKHWGTTVADAGRAKQLIDAGAKLLFSGADILVVKNALQQLRRDWQPLGLDFQDRFSPAL